ncbi:MAG: nucleotidyltransferase [Clostridia bacterium]|nr:MAG: nucleotidyltransferase [Clostridia bacterium]
MKAVIMAGGEGTRLRPLTCTRPKPMVSVLDQPVMAYAIELLRRYGISDIAVTLQYLPEAISNYFGDGSAWGVRLRYFVEESPLGTAGSVKNASQFLDEPFLVISGDALTDFDLGKAVSLHQDKSALATMVLTSVPNPLEYGVVIISPEDGRVRRFLEKPAWSEVFSDLVNTGIYLLQPEILDFIPDGQSFDFSKNLFPVLLDKGLPLYGLALDGYWCDIGHLGQYMQAHYDFLAGKVNLPIPGQEVARGVWMAAGASADPEAQLEPPVYLGRNSHVGAGAVVGPLTTLGAGCTVESMASVRRSLLGSMTHVGERAQLRGVVVGEGTRVGDRVEAFEQATIGDRCVVGSGSEIAPAVKIWPEKQIEAGSRVRSNLVWGNGCSRTLFVGRGITGQAALDLTPELVLQVVAAYGSHLKRGDRVVVSCCSRPAAAMLKEAATVGLQSTGIKVTDLGMVPASLHRHAVRYLEADGGVHVGYAPQNETALWFQLTDSRGIDLAASEQRQVENIFSRGEARRAAAGEIEPAHVAAVADVISSYREFLSAAPDHIRPGEYQVLLSSPAEEVRALAAAVLPAGVAMNGDAWLHPEAHGSKVGAYLDANGEVLWLALAPGQVLDPRDVFILAAVAGWETFPDSRLLAAPVSASQALEQLAGRYGAKVHRTKEDPRAVADVAWKQGCHWQVYSVFDGLYTLELIIGLAARQGRPLDQIVRDIPRLPLVLRETSCPWEAKGQVMRRLAEAIGGHPAEMLDGIKVYHPQGWVLILPHAQNPAYQIYAESFSQEAAEELTGFYEARLRQIINEVSQA